VIPALVVYVLAGMTVFALLKQAVADRHYADLFTVWAAIAAVLWPLYLPAVAFDWVLDKRAARGGR